MSEEMFADLYDWLVDAYESAMQLAQSQLAMQYLLQMRAMEQAGLVTVVKEGPTIH